MHHAGQAARVVDMGMREDDGVDVPCGDGQRLPVALAQLLASLEETAVDEHPLAVVLEEELGARDGARRAEEVNGGHARDSTWVRESANGVV